MITISKADLDKTIEVLKLLSDFEIPLVKIVDGKVAQDVYLQGTTLIIEADMPIFQDVDGCIALSDIGMLYKFCDVIFKGLDSNADVNIEIRMNEHLNTPESFIISSSDRKLRWPFSRLVQDIDNIPETDILGQYTLLCTLSLTSEDVDKLKSMLNIPRSIFAVALNFDKGTASLMAKIANSTAAGLLGDIPLEIHEQPEIPKAILRLPYFSKLKNVLKKKDCRMNIYVEDLSFTSGCTVELIVDAITIKAKTEAKVSS